MADPSRLVTRRPVVTLVVVLLLTIAFGAAATQSVNEDGAAGGADDERSQALDVLDERFGDRTAIVQVLVEDPDRGDVRSVDALERVRQLRTALEGGPFGDQLAADGQQPAVTSYLDPVDAAVEQRGLSVSDLDDDDVAELLDEGTEELPDAAAAQVQELLADPPSAGLVLVFVDVEAFDEEGSLARQREVVAQIEQVAASRDDGLELSPLAFALLTEDEDTGAEIGRLFGTALAIILLVLVLVSWTRPRSSPRGRLVRRTLADVGLIALVIVMAVVWMQGIGALLGPGVLGLIGPFNPQTQIVPVLIVGLGVDFSIHLFARYRSEIGQRRDPAAATGRTFATVGAALLLDTVATAIGFLTNLVSPVEFLATLGVLAAVGIGAAFVLTVTILPAVRVLLDRRAIERDRLPAEELAEVDASRLPRALGRVSRLAERAAVPIVLAALGLTAVGGYGFTQLDSRFELTDFVSRDAPELATFEAVQDRFGGGFGEPTQVLLTGDVATPDALEALRDALDDAAEVDGVETLDGEADATSVWSVIGTAAGEDEAFAAELAELGVGPDGEVADDADVDELFRSLLDETDEASEVLVEDGDGWIARVDVRTNVGTGGALALGDGLSDAFAPLEDTDVEVIVASQELVQATIAGDIEDAQLLSIGLALGAVMLLLVLYFGWSRRRPALGVLTVLPVAFVLGLLFGAMALTDIPLNPVTATLAALSIGIGVPFNIHVAARFVEEHEEDPEGALERAVSRSGGAVAASALTTAVGFGVLTTSSLLPFQQLGYVLVYAIVLSAIAATLVLPALLTLWSRRSAGS